MLHKFHNEWDPEEMRYDEEYRNLIRLLESSHLDNMKVIRAIFSTDDTPVLVIGNVKEKVICF